MTIRNKLHEAIIFATERHAGQKRKGTDIDYICHPMEVAQILTAMRPESDDLIIAGILHDVVEDKRATQEEVLARFGPHVADLVAAHTHPKTGNWVEDKRRANEELAKASFEVRQLVLADKTSNLRSMYADYLTLGDELWDRFNAGKHDQCIYYSEGLDALEDLQYYENTRDAYWEATELFKDLFVRYYIDAGAGRIWQVCDAGNTVLTKETLKWLPTEEPVSEDAVEESRFVAEIMEGHWVTAADETGGEPHDIH